MNMNPGSAEAIINGCRCPIWDNRHGQGIFTDANGVPQYIINETCPLHGTGAKNMAKSLDEIKKEVEEDLGRKPIKAEDIREEIKDPNGKTDGKQK